MKCYPHYRLSDDDQMCVDDKSFKLVQRTNRYQDELVINFLIHCYCFAK